MKRQPLQLDLNVFKEAVLEAVSNGGKEVFTTPTEDHPNVPYNIPGIEYIKISSANEREGVCIADYSTSGFEPKIPTKINIGNKAYSVLVISSDLPDPRVQNVPMRVFDEEN